MDTLIANGVVLIIAGAVLIGLALLTAQIASRRRQRSIGSEDLAIPLNLASVNDGVLVAEVGGRITFANETARAWFGLESSAPDLWLLAQKVRPSDSFLELFATEGQASFTIGEREIEASSHRVAVGESTQFIVVLREEAPLPVLGREERGSGRALHVLSEVTRQINASLDMDIVLRAILDGVRQVIPYDMAQITLVDQDKDRLNPVARSGPEEYVAITRDPDQVVRIDEGYTGWLARKRQPLLIPDVPAFREIDHFMRRGEPEYHAFMGVPLTVRNRFIGTLELMGRVPGSFDREDLSLLGLLAEQAAVAIENARQYRAQAERVAELSGLQKIAEAISDLRDPRQLYAQLGQRIAELMGVEMAGVLLYDRETERLIAQRPLHGVMDVFATRYEISLARGTSMRSLWEDVDYWFSNDVLNDYIVRESGLLELAELTGVRTTAMAAMTVGSDRIGVVQVSNKLNGAPFTMEDLRLLQIYADQAAIIVESARLYSEEQHRVAELQGLQQIAQTMSAFTNPEQLYGQLTQRIAELMNVEICGILMYDADEERLMARKPFYGMGDAITDDYSIAVGRRGLARDMWREYELFVSNHVFTDERIDDLGIRHMARTAGLQTLILAPLSAAGRRFGMLQVANKIDGSDFDDDDRRLATIFASQAAALIDNARLYQDTDATLRKRAAELRSVSRISRELNATIELEPILEVIAVEAQRAEGADFGSVVLFDWDEMQSEIRPRMRFGAQVGDAAVILETAAARSGETLIIDDFERVPHYPSPIPGVRSALLSPIYFEGKITGVVSLYGRRPGALGSSAAEFVQALCSQATIAITNATRHAEQVERSEIIRRRAEQLTQIFELGRMFRSDQSVEDNLASVARATCESAGFEVALIGTLSATGEHLLPIAQMGLEPTTFGRLSAAPPIWAELEPYLDDRYRLSFSYLVRHEESAPLVEMLGMQRPPDEIDGPDAWHSGDLILVPLRASSGDVLGLMIVDRPRDRRVPSRETVELLEIFGNQAAVVIENSRLYHSVEERARELSKSLASLERSYEELDKLSQEMIRKDIELSQANDLLNLRAQRLLALHRIMESVDTTRPPEEVLRDITASVVEEMDVDHCIIVLEDPERQEEERLRVVAAAGRIPEDVNLSMLLTPGDQVSTVCKTREAVLYTLDGKRDDPPARFAKAIGARTLAAIPMSFDTGRSGVLVIGSAAPGASFDEDERDLFTLLASQIVVEAENARLYAVVQSEAATAAAERDRLQQLHLITTALQQTQNPHDRLAVIARGIRSVGWNKVAVTLHDEDMSVLDFVTAGYTEAEAEALRQTLLPGPAWKKRFEDPEFNLLRLGSCYFLPHDHPWVTGKLGERGRGGKPITSPLEGVPIPWHPDDQLYLPLYAGAEIIGVINLRDPVSGQRPTEASLRPLELFAQQAASALENARLYHETLELQSFNEAVVQSIQQGIVVTNAEGVVESINSFLRDVYGWSEDIIGQNLFTVHPELDGLGLAEDIRAVVSSGERAERANVQLTVGDELRSLNIYVYPRREEAGVPAGAVVLMEDITDRARLEADIARRAMQLAALSEASRDITAVLNSDAVISSALAKAQGVIAFDRCAIWLHERGEEALILRGVQGYERPDELPGRRMPIEQNELFCEIVREKAPRLISDARKDGRIPKLDEGSALSWLGAPMLSGGQIIGVLVFERISAGAYAPADAQIASAYANQIAVALENARLFEEAADRATELASRTRRLALLNRISATLGQSLDQTSILQTVVDELAQALDVPHGSVYMFDHEGGVGRLTNIYPSAPDGSVPEYTIPLQNNPAIERLRRDKTPLAIADVTNDPLLEKMREPLASQGVRSTLIVPLVVGNLVTGMITIDSTTARREFEDEQIELAQTITNQAAVSVQNARLFQETVARQRELSLLSEAGQVASSSLDLDTVLRSAARYFMGALEADGCTISLWDESQDTLFALHDVSQRDGERPITADMHRRNLASYPATASLIKQRGSLVLEARSGTLSQSEQEWLRKRGIAQALVIPLVARDQTIGLIELWDTEERRRLTQRQIRLAGSLAATFATAMENARLHDETQKRLSELARINQISRALTQTISAEDLYQILAENVGEMMGANSITIARHNRRTGQITFPLAMRNNLRIHLDPIPHSGTLYSYVMEQREPVLIARGVDEKLRELGVRHIEPGLKSFLAVPLLSGETVFGVLAVEDYDRENAFHEATQRVMAPIAAQVAVSIENARLYSELELRLSETTTLQEVSRVVNSALDLQEIFERVVSELANAFRYPLISLYTVEDGDLVMQAHHGYNEETAARFQRIPTTRGIVGRAVLTGEPQFVEDVRKDRDYLPTHDWVTAEIAVPIVSDESVLGVLAIQSGEDNPLEQNDLHLLSTFAAQVSTAMTNAKLYRQMVELSEELEQRVEERTRELKEERDRIDTLYRIAVELAASLDLDMVLNRALELVGEAVNAEHGSLYLIDPHSDLLIHRAVMRGAEILPPGGRQIPLSRHEGMAGWVMDNQQSIVVDNVQEDDRWSNVPGTEHNRSLLGAPLVANYEVLGCIFFTSERVGAFNREHVRLVEAAAQQVANSINNAELYRMIRDQAERLGVMLRSQQTEAAKSQAILESVADGVMVSDQAGEIILFNAAAERILDLRREEVLGRPSRDLTGLYSAHMEQWAEIMDSWRADPDLFTGEYLTDQLEISGRVVSMHVSPVIHGGEYLGLVYVFRDITREVLSDRIKTQFVANVSHELRTPMTVIKGYADLLLLGRAGDVTPEQRNYLERIKRHADRLSLLVNDLLDISRIEQGSVELDLRDVDLREIIGDVVGAMRVRMGNEQRSLVFTTEMASDLPTIQGDYDRLTQVITNLVSNAYQYTDDDGRVTVRAYPEEDGVRVDVEDTGIGIPADDQQRVFDRFFRGDHPLIMRAAGTGLGLAIVHHLIEMHNGRVWFESQEGVGTTFSIWLPLTQAAKAG